MLFHFVIFSVLAFTSLGQDWQPLPGKARDISVKGDELWVINGDQNIFRFDGKTFQRIPGKAVRAGASSDGWTWIVNAGGVIYRYNPEKKKFEQMRGRLVQVSAASKNLAIGINAGKEISVWDVSRNGWKRMKGRAVWAAIGDDDDRWVINTKQEILRWDNGTDDWKTMPGKAVKIDVQNANRVVITDAENQVSIWNGNDWTSINGSCIRATINENSIYCVNSASEISQTVPELKIEWKLGRGKLREISAKGTEVWGASKDEKIWRLNGKAWSQIPGSAVRVSASSDGFAWKVAKDGSVSRWDPAGKQWDNSVTLAGGLIQINAISKDRALGVNKANEIWSYDGSWKKLAGSAMWVSIGDDNERWSINSDGNIFQWNAKTNGWTKRDGVAETIDVQDSSNIVATNKGQLQLRRNGVWRPIKGKSCARATINRDTIYCLTAEDEIFSTKLTASDSAATSTQEKDQPKKENPQKNKN